MVVVHHAILSIVLNKVVSAIGRVGVGVEVGANLEVVLVRVVWGVLGVFFRESVLHSFDWTVSSILV